MQSANFTNLYATHDTNRVKKLALCYVEKVNPTEKQSYLLFTEVFFYFAFHSLSRRQTTVAPLHIIHAIRLATVQYTAIYS